jgi:hypothetical protein
VDLAQPTLSGHGLDGLGKVLDARGGVAVAGDAVAVFAQQLHRVGELVEDGRDFPIPHAERVCRVYTRRTWLRR